MAAYFRQDGARCFVGGFVWVVCVAAYSRQDGARCFVGGFVWNAVMETEV